MEFLLAPTVPSAPRPKNIALVTPGVADDVGGVNVEAGVGDIVRDAHGEAVFRLVLGQLGEDRLDHRRREFLGGKAVAPADYFRHRGEVAGGDALRQRGEDILVERLAVGARLLRAVEHGNRADGFGSTSKKYFAAKGR